MKQTSFIIGLLCGVAAFGCGDDKDPLDPTAASTNPNPTSPSGPGTADPTPSTSDPGTSDPGTSDPGTSGPVTSAPTTSGTTASTTTDPGTGGSETSACIPGELGCACNGGLCLGGLECVAETCMKPDCSPGALGCECNGGLCLGSLVCVAGKCAECPNPDQIFCDGKCVDGQTSDDHCGACDNACVVRQVYGHCEAGQCTPTLSECQATTDRLVSCTEVCQKEGMTCAANQCDDSTFFISGSLIQCIDFLQTGSLGPCQEPLFPYDEFYRCCCAQQ